MANSDDTVTPLASGTWVLLQHFDTDFSDTTGRHTAITANGTAVISSTAKFGAGSFGDTSYSTPGYVTITDNLADFTFAGDFTIDAWVNCSNLGYSGSGVFDIGNTNLALRTEYYWTGSANIISLYARIGSLTLTDTRGISIITGTWYHYAVTRQGSTCYLFVNGTLVASGTYSGTPSPAASVTVGSYDTANWPLQGYIDELRIINGAAAWTANFTPPTAPYTVPPPGITGTLSITQAAQTLSATGTVVPVITGTLALTQAAQTLSAAGGPVVGGHLTVTQAAQTLSASGLLQARGTLAVTEVPDTLSAHGGPVVGGHLTVTQAAQTLSATGAPAAVGNLTVTQAVQTLSATGNVPAPVITGTLNITQAAQTLSATGSLILVGNLTVTQAAQTLSAAAGVRVGGTLAVTQANNTLTAAGGIQVGGVLSVTQAAQTLSAVGRVTVGGTLTVTQANNTLVAAGAVTVRGTLAVTQAAQTLSGTGSVLSGVVGALSLTQAAQTLSAVGTVPNVVGGTLTITQTTQTLAATGTVFTGITGTLARTQADNTITAAGGVRITGALAIAQDAQTLAATGTVQLPTGAITGILVLTQANQTLSATANIPSLGVEPMHTLSKGSLYVAGSVKTAAGPVSGLPHPGRAGTRNFVTDATVPFASGVGNIVTGGGSNKVPVYDDGANWRIG